MGCPIVSAAALSLIVAAPIAAAPPQPPAAPQSKAQVQAIIWAKEQAIYSARARGDLHPYLNSVATDYLAWPPFRAAPAGAEGLEQLQAKMAVENHEQLVMHFDALALNGDTAVIYYDTHRTRLPDGRPVDQRFNVTHTWVRENGSWKVLGGMACERKPPAQP